MKRKNTLRGTSHEEARAMKARIKKATDFISKACKELDEVDMYHLRLAEELHIVIHNFISTVSPAAGGNSDWQITWVHPSTLSDGGNPYPNSGDKPLSELARSIAQIGMINAIEADPGGVIITGHQRHRASLLGGFALVPVKVVKDLTPSQRIQHQVAENWTQRKGSAQNVNPMLLVNRMAQDGEGK